MRTGLGRRPVIWLLWVLLGYTAIAGALFAFQRRLQYLPSNSIQNAGQVTGGLMTSVSYRTSDGLDLSAWFHPPNDGMPTLVRFQGNGGQHGDRATAMRPYMERGYGVLLAGYRGYGRNPGSPTEQGLYADARAALDWLGAQGHDAGSVAIYGESLGSGVAVQMAAERNVAALILQSPFTSAVDVGQTSYPWLPVRVLLRDRYDSLSKIGRVTAPLLLIHGEADRVVPARQGRRLFEAANEPKTAHFIAEAAHNDLDSYDVAEVVLEFLKALPPLRR